MKHTLGFTKKDLHHLASAFLVTALLFYTSLYAYQVYAVTGAVTLTATVATSISFTTTTGSSDQFGTLTPGTFKYATTTLDVSTNDANGWTVSLSGDNKATGQNNLQLTGDTATQITDQQEWVPAVATTSPGTGAAIRASLDNSGNVLAFRVMTASTTNGTAFVSTSWWGSTDADGTAKFAGISSSTVQRLIGNAGAGSYSSSRHLNTVQYYLNVASSQKTGAYTAPLTFTAVGN